MKWINILGLCLQFFAFWFAAPELLGAETMKRFEEGMAKFISKIPALFIGFLGLALGIGLSFYGIKTGLQAKEGTGPYPFKNILIILLISAAYMVYMIFFYKKFQHFLAHSFAEPLVQKLINNNEARKTALLFGAMLFTTGFALQLFVLIYN